MSFPPTPPGWVDIKMLLRLEIFDIPNPIFLAISSRRRFDDLSCLFDDEVALSMPQ